MKALAPVEAWFASQGWRPLPFQRRCWRAFLAGESGLIQVPTGSGKTYAAVMGPIALLLREAGVAERGPGKGLEAGIRLVYITPLRALSRDLALAIRQPIEAMAWPIRVGIRNGDTPSAERTRQLRQPPQILITTPESLALLLSNANALALFGRLEAVVLDEWHELMGGKRGSQTELCLGWLRSLRPELRTWAISATLGNLAEAARSAVGVAAPEPTLICAQLKRGTEIRSLLPDSIDGFPWAGHLGLRMHEELVAALDPRIATLLFTNTRNQAERWYQCLRWACPEMEGALALHHSAIDRAEREAIEAGVKQGELRWVVCTSSLDLGVDFQPVERVVQIGSAKNLARLLQRAGRSAHIPGGTSQVLFMPTNALELLEVSAMRRGLATGLVEQRRPPRQPLDVLLQHLTSLACGPGFEPERELATVRDCWSYRQLDQASWEWCLRFLEQGGDCLGAYERFRKLERRPLPTPEGQGRFRYQVLDRTIARLHRLNIGTITADRAVTVRFVRGAVLGHVEEAFISRLKPGDVFFFAGRQLAFVRLRDMTALVQASTRRSTTVPAWAGGQMALSDLISRQLREEVDRCARALGNATAPLALETPHGPTSARASAARASAAMASAAGATSAMSSDVMASAARACAAGASAPLATAAPPASAAIAAAEAPTGLDTPELRALEPLLLRQADLSRIPRRDEFLVEVCRSREGSHLYAYPFEGRFVHEGLGFLWASRLARLQRATITVSVNDYGFELLASKGYPFEAMVREHQGSLLDATHLEQDLEEALNLSELCRRRFRAIAQISGLIVQGYPGKGRSGGQLQISASLLFDVFQRHEPANLLLAQARREVLQDQLELARLAEALERLRASAWVMEPIQRQGPLAFPLLAERLNNRLSNESLLERLEKLRAEACRAEGL